MKPLYSIEKYNAATGYVKLPLECYHCSKTFFAEKKYIKSILKRGIVGCKFCSNDCNAKFFRTSIEAPCSQCGKEVIRQPKEVRKSKSKKIFCNRSCSASYNNTHKAFGTVRSKLEIWIEERLREQYPHLEIVCNRKGAIQSELDIYLPKLQLAFELNGLFHYQPVFGEEKLAAIQKMDEVKKVACQAAGIKLVSIDISDQSKFHPGTSGKYLQMVCERIEEMLSARQSI